MAGTFVINGSNLIITFTYIGPIQNVTDIARSAARQLWDRGMGDHGDPADPVMFASLSDQQKLNIIDTYVLRVILDAASDSYVNIAVETARIQAQSDAATKLRI